MMSAVQEMEENRYMTRCSRYPRRAVMVFGDHSIRDCLEMNSLFQQKMIKTEAGWEGGSTERLPYPFPDMCET